MTYIEYARKNLDTMLNKQPTAQDVRDVALLSLWLDLMDGEGQTPTQKQNAVEREFEPHRELSDIFPALSIYKGEHNEINLKRLCIEIEEFCRSVYASTRNEAERAIYRTMIEKLNK